MFIVLLRVFVVDFVFVFFMIYVLVIGGFEVSCFGRGSDALDFLAKNTIDLLLLDLGLPDIDGMTVLKKIRVFSQLPIIIVSARDQEAEKVEALDMGADDYLTKPFKASELLARIRVALRHYYRMNHLEELAQEDNHIYVNGDLKIDNGAHKVFKGEEEIHLTPIEYKLLLMFMKNIGKVLTYSAILKEVWDNSYDQDNSIIRSAMASTRRKIENNPARPEYIETELGIGYRMREH